MEQKQDKSQFENFEVIEQLGKGSFGTVYKAKHKKQDGKLYAIKVQTIGAIKPMLHLQHQILAKLNQHQLQIKSMKKGFSILEVLLYKEEEYFSYMAMQLLDTTLQDFANKEMKNIFSKDCLIRVFYNILRIVEMIHKLGYVHRDIKPANFMLKINPQYDEKSRVNQKYLPYIYPIDLGLCKSYINPITRQHIPCKQNKKMVGTAMFCSLNTHQGLEQSRRDDIEAIIYMVTYLVKKLPWQSVCNKEIVQKIDAKNQLQSPKKKMQQKQKLDKYEEIYQVKKAINFNQFFNDPELLPKCFVAIYKIVNKIQFEEQPNYSQIYDLLEKQHFQLTGQQISLDQSQCKWENLSKNKIQQSKDSNDEPKKKIKINFKVPPNKIKKPISQNAPQSILKQVDLLTQKD